MKTVRERLSQWEAKLAPISDEQKQVIVDLSSATAQRPLPDNVREFAHSFYRLRDFSGYM